MSAMVCAPDDALAVAARETASAYPYAFGIEGQGGKADTKLALPAYTEAQNFPARMHLLIKRAGGTSALARCCGVTARTVRNWSDGHGDISRERCLRLARAMRISPLWLMSGEGGMTDEAAEQAPAPRRGVDSELLAAALQVLQSYIVLAGGSLSVAQRAEAIVELYGILAQPGPADAGRVIAFHKRLAAWLRSNHQALTA